ncbi:MAG: hypothetical protein D6712_11130 [Chloroflexi bacterium]|nr:MAG: hypothetical protein D6712_11130 [Chloroflexota bacterium]
MTKTNEIDNFINSVEGYAERFNENKYPDAYLFSAYEIADDLKQTDQIDKAFQQHEAHNECPICKIKDAVHWKWYGVPKDQNLMNAFECALKNKDKWKDDDTGDKLYSHLTTQCKMPQVTAAFITHVFFPDKAPIVDQHTKRAIRNLYGIKRVTYKGFKNKFNELDEKLKECKNMKNKNDRERRRLLDKALFVYGKGLNEKNNPTNR